MIICDITTVQHFIFMQYFTVTKIAVTSSCDRRSTILHMDVLKMLEFAALLSLLTGQKTKKCTVCSAAQGHASFTIEFDNTSPGKVTIKDHVSKFASDHHRSRTKKSAAGSGGSGSKDLTTLQAAMMASESKVADWLAHNDPTLVRSESTEDDSKSTKSIKSDVPVHLKRLKGTGPSLGTLSVLSA